VLWFERSVVEEQLGITELVKFIDNNIILIGNPQKNRDKAPEGQ